MTLFFFSRLIWNSSLRERTIYFLTRCLRLNTRRQSDERINFFSLLILFPSNECLRWNMWRYTEISNDFIRLRLTHASFLFNLSLMSTAFLIFYFAILVFVCHLFTHFSWPKRNANTSADCDCAFIQRLIVIVVLDFGQISPTNKKHTQLMNPVLSASRKQKYSIELK